MFSPEGEAVAVTLISAETNAILLRRNESKDGYKAVQLGLSRKNSKKAEKLTPGAMKRQYEARREFSFEVKDDVQKIGLEQFVVGDVVRIAGVSKGKGFQGVVKRHGFAGGPKSHGHRHVLRAPGSIGSAFPEHVMKGKRMAGRMGSDRVTVKNLPIMWIDAEKNVLAVKGAIPGTRGSVVELISD